MVTFRRKHIPVASERRRKNRIEFHLPVVILGVDDKAQIVDFSPDGFHIELAHHTNLKIGGQIYLALKPPSERNVLKIKARVVYKDGTGIGCQFIDRSPRLNDILDRCFNIFNGTLPI